MTAIKAAKKSHPAVKRNVSVVMRVPQLAHHRLRPSKSDVEDPHFSRKERARSGAPGRRRCLRLLFRSWRRFMHVLLHVGFVVGLHLLHFRLLVRREQLVHLVVNARLGYGQFGLDL
jgi:hypothetical protein